MKRTLLGLGLLAAATTASAEGTRWTVTHEWSPTFERKFSQFVATMGASGCTNLTACLKSPKANPFYASRSPKRTFPADCADLPYALRMYFAWAEGLPFDYVSKTVAAEPNRERARDIRYTTYGNKPGSWRSIQSGKTHDFADEYEAMRDAVSTATFRMHHDQISDFYPPALSLDGIRPGTVVYDPSGHVAVVYKIEDDGRIRLFDAHPDNSISHITFDRKFARSRVAHGAGFKNWRPELDRRPTNHLAGFSTDGFAKSYNLGGKELSYYEFVRAKLAGGALTFDPVAEVKNMMLDLCDNLHDREVSVAAAIQSKIDRAPHPDRLPENIYGTSGDWERFATASRDARLRLAFSELRAQTQQLVERYENGDPEIRFEPDASLVHARNCGNDRGCLLAAALMQAYEDIAAGPACRFTYVNTRGESVEMSYPDVEKRVLRLSFDPYHCVELRWGEDGTGLNSCSDDRYKMQWYAAEQGLRNETERAYETRMDYGLEDTKKLLGHPRAPDVELLPYLEGRLHPQHMGVLAGY